LFQEKIEKTNSLTHLYIKHLLKHLDKEQFDMGQCTLIHCQTCIEKRNNQTSASFVIHNTQELDYKECLNKSKELSGLLKNNSKYEICITEIEYIISNAVKYQISITPYLNYLEEDEITIPKNIELTLLKFNPSLELNILERRDYQEQKQIVYAITVPSKLKHEIIFDTMIEIMKNFISIN